MARRLRTLRAVLPVAILWSCAAHERGELVVELARPPVATRFIVHGNCFAGWYLNVDLSFREIRGVDVLLESLSFRVEDDRTGESLGEHTLDAAALRDRLGEGGALVRAHGSLELRMGVGAIEGRVDAPARSGPVTVSGELRGQDRDGAVRASYRLTATPTIDDRPVPSSGACTPRT